MGAGMHSVPARHCGALARHRGAQAIACPSKTLCVAPWQDTAVLTPDNNVPARHHGALASARRGALMRHHSAQTMMPQQDTMAPQQDTGVVLGRQGCPPARHSVSQQDTMVLGQGKTQQCSQTMVPQQDTVVPQ